MENAESAIATLDELKARGINISIDDFGTGYSSLSYLEALSAGHSEDRPFVRARHRIDSDDAAIVEAIIALARSLDIKVVAEGVETRKPGGVPEPIRLRLRPGLPLQPSGPSG